MIRRCCILSFLDGDLLGSHALQHGLFFVGQQEEQGIATTVLARCSTGAVDVFVCVLGAVVLNDPVDFRKI